MSAPSEPRPTELSVPRWLGPVLGLMALVMVPWTAYLAMTLPMRHVTGHYRAAWVGFDLALVLGLAATGWYVWRARTRAELPATITATLLVVDGWFDIMTSHGNDEVYGAIAASLLLELPLAAVCLWIALHAESVRTYRTHLLAERAEHRLAGGPAGHHHPHDPPR